MFFERFLGFAGLGREICLQFVDGVGGFVARSVRGGGSAAAAGFSAAGFAASACKVFTSFSSVSSSLRIVSSSAIGVLPAPVSSLAWQSTRLNCRLVDMYQINVAAIKYSLCCESIAKAN